MYVLWKIALCTLQEIPLDISAKQDPDVREKLRKQYDQPQKFLQWCFNSH